jgi:hypothetical protein
VTRVNQIGAAAMDATKGNGALEMGELVKRARGSLAAEEIGAQESSKGTGGPPLSYVLATAWFKMFETRVRRYILLRYCRGAARPRCIGALGVPLERPPPASPPGKS